MATNSHCPGRGRTALGLPSFVSFLSCILLLSCSSSSLSSHFTLAQDVPSPYITPISVSGPAVARTATKLYIAGGNNSYIIPQFVSLDLSVPWNATRPAWQELAHGPQQNIFPAAFSADQKTMIAFHCGSVFAMRYDVANNTWTNSSAFEKYGFYQGIGAVTDPSSGLVYLAGGYTTDTRNSMSIYDFNTDAFQPNSPSLPNPATIFAARAYYGNVFSKQRNSILYFGGYNSSLDPVPKQNVVSEYVPSTGYWQSLITSGVPPAMRSDHCMTANDDGSLVIIYGGRVGANFVNGLYILDTATQIWRSGTGGMARAYAACTIAGNQLLIWGGRDAYNEIVSTDVQIYNIDTDTWITTYTPPDSYSGNSTLSGKRSSSHAGAIAGGVVGGFALIMAAILLFVFRRRRRESRYSRSLVNSDYEEEDRKPAAQPTSDANEEEVRALRAHIQTQQEELDMQRRLLIVQQERNQEYQRQQLILQQQQLQQDQQELYPSGYSYQSPPVNFGAGTSTPEPHNYESVGIPLVAQTSIYHPPPPSTINPYPPQPYQPSPSPEPSGALTSVASFSNTGPLENPGNPQFGARERLR